MAVHTHTHTHTHTHILPYIDNKNKFYIIILDQRTCHGKIVENTIEERIQSIRKHKQGKSKCKIK